jgi:transcriptional regulator with XRE-family HTH domain
MSSGVVMAETIGERVRRLREAAGLTQKQLAERAGVPLPTLRQVEQMVTKAPRPETLLGLARALGVKVGELMGEE